MFRSSYGPGAFLLVSAILVSSCSKPRPQPKGTSSAAASSSAVAPPATVSAAAHRADPADAAPRLSCHVEEARVWSGRPNLLTGLTPTRFDDGRFAAGVWLSGRPQVLVFDREGRGEALRVPTREALRTAPEEGRTRTVLRVTPAIGSREAVTAFVDYREESEEQRSVWCGRAESDIPLVGFEGRRLPLPEPEKEKDDSVRRQYATAAKKGSEAKPRVETPAKGLSMRPLRGKGQPGSLHAKSVQDARARRRLRERVETEVLDCRTLVGAGGVHPWAVGTLASRSRKEGYRAELFAERPQGAGRVVLHTEQLGEGPERIDSFESPVAVDAGQGRVALAVRYKGSLMVWLLGPDKTRLGKVRVYSGGSPTLPRVGDAARPLLLTSVRARGGDYALRYLQIAEALPDALGLFETPSNDESWAEPGLATVGSRRLLSYQVGPRKAAGLRVVPLDAALRPTGESIAIAAPEEAVTESLIAALGPERAVVVYLRAPKGQPELVSRMIRCQS